MEFSSSTLALLTALIAVSGLVLPTLHAFLWPTSVSFHGTTEDHHLLVLVTNRTGSEIYLEKVELSGGLLPQGPHELAPVGEDDRFVDKNRIPFAPGESTSLRLRPKDGLDLDGVPDSRTAFELRVDVSPDRIWSRHVKVLTGIAEFVCAWDIEHPCRSKAESPAEGESP
jgi:hypothetical protein